MLNLQNIYKRYFKRFMLKDSEKNKDVYFKLYSDVELEEVEREEFGRRQINYDSQLRKGDIIEEKSGIWVFSDKQLAEVLRSPNARNHYGSKLMIVKMLDDQRYIHNYIEFIGRKYEVIKTFDLRTVEDYEKLKKYLELNYSEIMNIRMAIEGEINKIIFRAKNWEIIDENNISSDAIAKIFSI